MSEIILTGQKSHQCPQLLEEVRTLAREALDDTKFHASVDSISNLGCSALRIMKKNYESILQNRKREASRRSVAFPKYPYQPQNHKTTLKDIERLPW